MRTKITRIWGPGRPLALIFLAAAYLTACGGGGGGGSSAGPAGPCVVADVPGVPNLMGEPFFSPTSVPPGGSVDVNIPIDSDTGFITVTLLTAHRSPAALPVNHPVSLIGDQTAVVTVTVNSGAADDLYFPQLNLCTDFGSCVGSPSSTGKGVAYTTDDLTLPGPNYIGFTYADSGTIPPDPPVEETCLEVPYLSVSTG